MKKSSRNLGASVAIISILFISCQLDTSGQYTYQSPDDKKDGIEIGTLEAVNIDETWIERAVNEIKLGRYNEIHSLLIYRNDALVLEEYFPGHKYQWDAPGHHGEWVTWNSEMLHDIKSDTKSITSVCVGIAIDKGFIKDVHQSIFDYLPDYLHFNTDGKENITIEHLVTMTSGIQWDEWGAPLSSARNDIVGLWFDCEDQIACILERPLVSEPGTSFTYCGANHILLGEIIRHATDMDIDAFSQEYLFDPLGIDSVNWSVRFPNGVIEAAGGLELRPRDMVKIGATFLNEGVWKEEQIISTQWVEMSSHVYGDNYGINIPGTDAKRNEYAYSWWIKYPGKKSQTFYAGGWGGQKIMVFPVLNAVVVFTGGNYTSRTRNFAILEKYILPAID